MAKQTYKRHLNKKAKPNQTFEKKNEDKVEAITYQEGITVGELANKLHKNSGDIIKILFMLGKMVTINSVLDDENVELICLEYNVEATKEAAKEDETLLDTEEDDPNDLTERAPIVTIMGHVDHGKTTLLDYIRNSHIAAGEAGGITQSIGAYQIDYNGNKLTFIDTPGHAAFTEMRARGAQVTDIVIIIVSAEDGVMPQTKEAIDHAKASKVPIVVAVNKMDSPKANPDRVMQEMSAEGITPEEWGGEYPFVRISALTGEGVPALIDTLLAIAEVGELKANPNRYATGTVIESRIDKNMGGVASLLIQNGTLRIGDPIVVGLTNGRVRTMKNDQGKDIVSAGPSTPVEITGLNGNPEAGDKFMAFETEKKAREVAEKRVVDSKAKASAPKSLSLDDLFASIQSGVKEINVVLKCDVRGSEEACKNSLEKIDVEGVKIKVIRSGIGTVTESDISLAQASNAIIIGFNVIPSNQIKDSAKSVGVELRTYTIIYKLVEEMEAAMKGMLDPEFEEKVTGNAEVRKMFKFSKVGNIAGVFVTDGVVKSNSQVRVIRDGVIIYDGKVGSLQRGKDNVHEVKSGFECGMTIEGYNDIKEGDVFQTYEMVEVKR